MSNPNPASRGLKLKYSSLKGTHYTINFLRDVSTAQFEPIVKECFFRSKYKNINPITMNLSNVGFFDIFELSLIVLWLLELKRRGKEVDVILPSPGTGSYKFLQRYAFEKFLNDNKITYKKTDSAIQPYLDFYRASFLPLAFAYEDNFQDYISKLPDLTSLRDADIVNSGDFKNVIVNELRDNIQKHANDISPYIIMTKFSMKDDPEDQKKFLKFIQNRANNSVEWEKSFFQSLIQLPNPSFFELVIGDGGPGIPNVLGRIPQFKNIRQSEIIDAAFEYDVSSNPEKRWEPIERWIKDEIQDFKHYPPATGLYWVKHIMREYNGFISVRSGRTILCYDFLTYEERGRPANRLLTNTTCNLPRKDLGLKNLASFIGTQYKIYFPIQRLPYEKKKSFVEIPPYKGASFKISHMHLRDYFSGKFSVDEQFKALKQILLDLAEKIYALKINLQPTEKGVAIVDFWGVNKNYISSKVLHYLFLEMMRRQDISILIIPVNIDRDIILEVVYLPGDKKHVGISKEKALTTLDRELLLDFVGISEKEGKVLRKIVEETISVNDASNEELKVIGVNRHLIYVSGDKYHISHPYHAVVNRVLEALKNIIKSYILNPNNSIYHEKERVNIHNRYHVEGFFELYKLLENDEWRGYLQKLLEWQVRAAKIQILITIGRNSKTLFESLNLKVREWIHIENAFDPGALPYTKIIEIEKNDRILLFSEVIGTGSSLKRVLEFLGDFRVSLIMTIVDARKEDTDIKDTEFEYKGMRIKLDSIVRKPLLFHDSKPGNWGYETIRSVDLYTYALLLKPVSPPGKAIWEAMGYDENEIDGDLVQNFKNPFFDKIVPASQCAIWGHFKAGLGKHVTYFFRVQNIVDVFSKEIAQVIYSDIQAIKDKVANLKITHIIYPNYNPGVDLLMESVSNKFPGSVRFGVSKNEVGNILSERKDWKGDLGKVENAIVFDDSFSTGFTLERLIDIAYRGGPPRFIFAYVLMDRSDPFTSKFLENFSGYGLEEKSEIRVKHLLDSTIPLFNVSECPLCGYQKKLEILDDELAKLNLENLGFRLVIANEMKRLRLIEVESISQADVSLLTTEECSLRWKLEIAKQFMGARNQLRRIAERYIEHQEEVLNLLNVIKRELVYFFINKKDQFEEVFYKSLKEKLIEACQYFSQDMQIFSGYIGEIVLVWFFLDVDDILDKINNLLGDCYKNKPSIFVDVVGYLLIAEAVSGGRQFGKVVDVLTSFINLNTEHLDPTISWDLSKIVEYLQQREEKIALPSIYKGYSDAIIGPYYFDQNYDSIFEKMAQGKGEEAKKTFDDLIVHLKINLRGTDLLLRSKILTGRENSELNKNHVLLSQMIKKYENLRKTINIEDEAFQEMISRLKFIFNNIKSIISRMKCEIPASVDKVLAENRKVREIIDSLNVEIERDFSDGSEYAFIRSGAFEQVLMELFTNLRHAYDPKWSEAKKVKISTRMGSSTDFIYLEIYDSGLMRKEKKYKKGHSLIESIVGEYGGKFYPLQELSPTDKNCTFGFKKKSLIYLVNIPKPQRLA